MPAMVRTTMKKKMVRTERASQKVPVLGGAVRLGDVADGDWWRTDIYFSSPVLPPAGFSSSPAAPTLTFLPSSRPYAPRVYTVLLGERTLRIITYSASWMPSST